MFKKSIIETIKRRRSCRTFKNEAPSKEIIDKLKSFTEKKHKTIFGSDVELYLYDQDISKNFGTYGFIKGAQFFGSGSVKKSREGTIDFGYLFEKWILLATELDLGTCWLGGSLKREQFSSISNISDDKFIPAATPIGISAEKKRLTEKIMRGVFSSHKRKPFEDLFFDQNMEPLDKESEQYKNYIEPLEMVRVAPSGVNKQPWRVIIDQNGVNFYIERTISSTKYSVDIQMLDIGIALAHFELTVNKNGLKGGWKELKNTPEGGKKWEYIITWVE